MKKSEIAFSELGIVTETYRKPNGSYQIVRFDSLFECANKIQIGHQKGIFKNDPRCSSWKFYDEDGSYRNSWQFGKEFTTYQQNYNAMEMGIASQKTLKQVIELRESTLDKGAIKELQYQAKTLKKKRKFSDSGSELDIDRVLCGDPEHWMSLTPGKEKPVIRIAVNLSLSGCYDGDKICRISSYAIIACELLSMAGFNVEFYALYITSGTTSTNRQAGMQIKIKDATERIDINKLCCIGLIGITRTHQFSCIHNILDGQHDSGYGMPDGVCSELREELKMDFYIDSYWTEKQLEIELANILIPKQPVS